MPSSEIVLFDDRVLASFWSKVERGDGCWVWTAGVRSGYGQFRADYDRFSAHRFSWLISKGTIPVGFLVLQTCGNRLCVNPGHLVLARRVEVHAPVAG